VKLVLLGDAGVGKTSLVSRWCKDVFRPDQQQTIGAAFTEKEFTCDDVKYRLQIWDTAGQERFESMAPVYSQNARGALLVFDLMQRDTLEHVQKWRGYLDNCADGLPIVIAGNKSDLESERQVSFEGAMHASQVMNAEYFETSAQLGAFVGEAFTALAEAAVRRSTRREEVDPPLLIEASVSRNAGSENSGCC
jgi:small GTP-binding protein